MSVNHNVDLQYYKHTCPVSTRWSDNDQYGHLNNSIYYHLFDAIANAYLVTQCGLDPQSTSLTVTETSHKDGYHDDVASSSSGGPIGLVIASGCRYWSSLEFPQPLIGGLTVAKIGRSSVTYHLGVAKASDATSPQTSNETAKVAASGWMTHVFVDPKTRRPVEMTKRCRDALMRIASDEVLASTAKL